MQRFVLARCLYDEASQREAITRVLEQVRPSVPWTQALEQPGDDEAYRGPSRRGRTVRAAGPDHQTLGVP